MRISSARLRHRTTLVAWCFLGACGGGEGATSPSSIDVALSTTAVSLARGASSTVTVTVARTNFAGDVQLFVEHGVSGLTTTLADAVLPAGQSQTTLHVDVGTAAAIGTGSVVVRARGANVSDKTAALALTVTQAVGFTLDVSTGLQLSPGQSGVVNVAIARTDFAAPVTLAAEGLPAGATASFAPNPSTTTTSSLTISTGTAAAGTYAITVRGTAGGLTDRVVTFSLVIAAPTYALTLSGTTLTLRQGQTSSLAIAISRSAFAGPIAFTLTGLPAGSTASFSPASTDGAGTVLLVSSGTAAAGTGNVTVHANAAGLVERTATFAFTVTAAPSPTAIAYQLCTIVAPVWAGYQSGTGAWTGLPISADGRYNFSVAGQGGLAFVLPEYGDGARFGYEVRIIYASAVELQSFGADPCVAGTRTVHGSVSGLQTNEFAAIALGSAVTLIDGQTGATPAFTLAGVIPGPHDLLATRQLASGDVARIIIGRDLDPADGATLPLLDFAATSAATPIKSTATVTGTAATPLVISQFLTANGTAALLTVAEGSTVAYSGLPAASLAAGDLHAVAGLADESSGLRGVVTYNRQVAPRALVLGPAIAQPSVTPISTGPFARLQLLLPSQPLYQAFAFTEFAQGVDSTAGSRRVNLFATADYFNGLPGAWVLAIPDLPVVPGFAAAWGLSASTNTSIYLEVDGGLAATAPTTDGSEFRFVTAQGVTTTASMARFTPRATTRLRPAAVMPTGRRVLGRPLARSMLH